jgi:hypothetical protein
VRAEGLEGGFGVGFGSGGDVAAFGVEHDGDHRAHAVGLLLDGFDDGFERRPTVRAELLEEGGVGFKGRSVGSGLFNEIQAEVQRALGGWLREVRNVRVESHAEERGTVVDTSFEEREERFHGFSSVRCEVSGVRKNLIPDT